jgi:hypothetical protein
MQRQNLLLLLSHQSWQWLPEPGSLILVLVSVGHFHRKLMTLLGRCSLLLRVIVLVDRYHRWKAYARDHCSLRLMEMLGHRLVKLLEYSMEGRCWKSRYWQDHWKDCW